MPELPEVETVRRDLEAEFAGRIIGSVTAGGTRTLRRHATPDEVIGLVRGQRLVAAGRRGKYLTLTLGNGDVVVVHLGMSGQLLKAAAGAPLARHTHFVFGFEGGSELRFVDPRTFGEIFVATPVGPGGALRELSHLGPDPLEDIGDPDALAAVLAGRTTRLKPLMMDQTRISGIGNMYADEILFAARLRFDRPALSLRPPDVGRLHRAMHSVLDAAIAHRGSSFADEQYRDLYGELGGYQRLHNVYAREGLACPACASPIERVKFAGRSNFFCPSCQE